MLRYLRWHVWAPGAAAFYRGLGRLFGWWPLALVGRPAPGPRAPLRLAYFHHAFPVLTETFIQREVTALRAAGLPLEVLSYEAVGAAHFDEQARALMATTVYLRPPRPGGLPPGWRELARRHPLRLANAFLWLLFRQHTPRKGFRRDRDLFRRVLQLATELRARRITHVHTPWANPDATVALLAARLADARYSVQARASDIHRAGAEHGRRERLAAAAFVVTNTEYNQRILRGWLAGAAAPIALIRNGIELRDFAPPARTPGDGPLRVLCVGRLTAPKGIDALLRACALLRDAGQAPACAIIGGRVEDEVNHYLHLRRLHRALGLADVVRFLGPLPFARVRERYARADVVVLPAVQASDGRREVTPNALLEAMAMGCAVVSTPIGGIPEIIEDGVSGLLVPPRDAPALAAALARLGGDPALRARLGAAARARIEERFDIARNIRQYVALFAPELTPAPPGGGETA